MLHQARIALGHTRHASQGAPWRLANAHPLQAGALVGTVNGDIDQAGLRRRLPPGLPTPQGETDSEILLLALTAYAATLGPSARC
jgi:glucosamine 6-phosphate synthetase-like amidotransferase/phosphosugar isomerase protein